VMGLNSSVTVEREGRCMSEFYIAPFFVSIDVDTMCCVICRAASVFRLGRVVPDAEAAQLDVETLPRQTQHFSG